MAGNYNRNTYNSALYNAGRNDAGAIIRSIISAHTGSHIQAVVGGDPSDSAESGFGISFISDFTIQEGSLKKPPACYFFPDLSARILVVMSQVDNLSAFIRAFSFKDLPASIFLVRSQPNLPANIFALVQKDLSAFLFGKLAEKDLPATIFVPVHDLAGQMLGIESPSFRGRIVASPAGNLRAIIWSPTDLSAIIGSVQLGDLTARVIGFGFRDLTGQMLGVSAPNLIGFLRTFVNQTSDIPASTVGRLPEDDILGASIIQSFGNTSTGPGTGISATITSAGYSLAAIVLGGFVGAPSNLGALIKTGGELDLGVVIDFLSGANIPGIIGVRSIDTLANLSSFVQPVTPHDLPVAIIIDSNLKSLAASIEALRDSADMGGFLRVSETFVTAIYNIITLGSVNLRATIGKPECEGGSANAVLGASVTPQFVGDMSASIESFLTNNLGAQINTNTMFRTLDFINVSYSKKRNRKKFFKTTDTVQVVYSPFRGASLAAVITATSPESTLLASITPEFLPLRVVPNVEILTAADLRFGKDLNIQQIRLQLEGSLVEYFYVNDTQNAFIKDPNKNWKINIRAFRPIAENLFGDFAAARICKLGDLTSYPTIDAAVRACIAAVIGLEGQRDLNISITATGGTFNLPTTLSVSDIFGNLSGIIRLISVEPDLSANICGLFAAIRATIVPKLPLSATLSIDPQDGVYPIAKLHASIVAV